MSLSHKTQAGAAVTCHLSPGLAWSPEMLAQSVQRLTRCPVLAFCQGSDRASVQGSPHPHSPNPAEAKHSEVKRPIPRPHSGLPAFVVPPSLCLLGSQTQSLLLLTKQWSGSNSWPPTCQASSLSTPLVCGHCLLSTHSLPGLAQEASSSACSCRSLCSFPPANPSRAGGRLAPTVYVWSMGGREGSCGLQRVKHSSYQSSTLS